MNLYIYEMLLMSLWEASSLLINVSMNCLCEEQLFQEQKSYVDNNID